jgi:UDP-N-acetylglucosamine 2-epimerase (non-hydrolysing)
MKVATILGTRPEIIRLSLIIKKLDQLADQHILIHTGQNYVYKLSDMFFHELDIRKPDYVLNNKQQTLGQQLSNMFKELEIIFKNEKPNKVLVLGDTNSALSAVLAERMDIPVIHMEAGNRCFDWDVPEEKNRRVIDAISSFNLPYTKQSRDNLLKEGIDGSRIMVSGNPIYEVLNHYKASISSSSIMSQLNLKPKDYFLATIHRAENVDDLSNLIEIFKGINMVAEKYQKRVICSIHPRTQSWINGLKALEIHPYVEFYDPFSFFDFVHLEKKSICVITDSGTVQEECCIYMIPVVTARNTTERQETVECGSNIVSGIGAEKILQAVNVMVSQSKTWTCPEGYMDKNVSDKVIKFIFGGVKIVR